MKIRSNLAVSEDGFVFDPKSGESFTVNEVGVQIIQQLNAGEDIEGVKAHLIEQYEIDPYTLEKSIQDFIYMMDEFKLLEHE
jgi:hypothetical protein